jgi:CO dehydrogenase nickel-insertion accessory protein CooC1
MAAEIQVKNVKIIANKVDGPADEQFIRQALPEQEILAFLPYLGEIKKADRNEQSVLSHLPPEVLSTLEGVIKGL